MNEKRLRVGVVGCGNIFQADLTNSPMFLGVRVVACADINPAAALRRARDQGLTHISVDDILTGPMLISF